MMHNSRTGFCERYLPSEEETMVRTWKKGFDERKVTVS
jgi:hypothetical protein